MNILQLIFTTVQRSRKKTVVERYFESFACLEGKYSLDALHLSVDLLETISFKNGLYLVPVKINQARLLEDCMPIEAHLCAAGRYSSVEKGRGRLENQKQFWLPFGRGKFWMSVGVIAVYKL